ncbi:30S ribosomal protein S16 [Buchnera aphidicola (Muscaphis stroyani)]|uniref:Small ribosomal subunit protein bS16 n=1 Tax=Buchnera aphidicola (Muscaphis stroyani) TaxID=1241869 RepID=A0A4D6Y5M8_9GAMM|nr:30S ribosomal protein S16 [Buchnera aphidicola]QCI24449.1 30S ribosomal protein S16 [Buchnera aphidicola (Muscaphis stroyani)]
MVKIRLSRYGIKKRPFYKIVVADSRFPRNGRFIERIGYFDPISKSLLGSLQINLNRVEYWIKKGALISERAKKLIQIQKNKKDSNN